MRRRAPHRCACGRDVRKGAPKTKLDKRTVTAMPDGSPERQAMCQPPATLAQAASCTVKERVWPGSYDESMGAGKKRQVKEGTDAKHVLSSATGPFLPRKHLH